MNAQPFFSIVIPVYNRAHLIGKAIASVLAQTFRDYELIVIDDGSTDDPGSVVRQWQDPRILFFRIPNSERGAARNEGTRHATGTYLTFFDSDDVLYPDHFEKAHAFALENSNPEFFHTGYNIQDDQGRQLSVAQFSRSTDRSGLHLMDQLIVTNFLGCDSVFLRRDIAIGNPFNEDRRLASSEDWELWLRIAARYPLLSNDAVTFAMIHHPGRSLLTISPDQIIVRDKLLIDYLLKDQPFRQKFGHRLSGFRADRYTFFALCLSLSAGRRSEAFQNLLQAFRYDPLVLTRKRFWATLRIIVRSWFNK